jgi:hypothetical protein
MLSIGAACHQERRSRPIRQTLVAPSPGGVQRLRGTRLACGRVSDAGQRDAPDGLGHLSRLPEPEFLASRLKRLKLLAVPACEGAQRPRLPRIGPVLPASTATALQAGGRPRPRAFPTMQPAAAPTPHRRTLARGLAPRQRTASRRRRPVARWVPILEPAAPLSTGFIGHFSCPSPLARPRQFDPRTRTMSWTRSRRRSPRGCRRTTTRSCLMPNSSRGSRPSTTLATHSTLTPKRAASPASGTPRIRVSRKLSHCNPCQPEGCLSLGASNLSPLHHLLSWVV